MLLKSDCSGISKDLIGNVHQWALGNHAGAERLRVRAPERTITPLSVDEEAGMVLSSFRTSRDLGHRRFDAAAGFRSQEILDLDQDLIWRSPEAQIRVRGKGNRTRFLPSAAGSHSLLDHYL